MSLLRPYFACQGVEGNREGEVHRLHPGSPVSIQELQDAIAAMNTKPGRLR